LKVLLVEDSPRLQRSISAGLRAIGHVVDQAFDGREALNFAESYEYEVVILDLQLPEVDGLTVLRTLRQQKCSARVLILSARDQTEDRIRGLDLGADDYLVKPFAFDELVSRIRALSRRQFDYQNDEVEIGSLRIDTAARQASVSGDVIALTPTEFSLLAYLARRRGQAISHQQLINQLYDASADITKNAIEAHISSLRRKLGAAGASSVINTRRGFGYVIERS